MRGGRTPLRRLKKDVVCRIFSSSKAMAYAGLHVAQIPGARQDKFEKSYVYPNEKNPFHAKTMIQINK